MKRNYESPQMCWVPICSSRAVADICWGFVNNQKRFYYNTFGTGYAELYVTGKKCDRNVRFVTKYYPENMSEADRIKADQHMQQVIQETLDALPNNANPFKGSPFADSPDSSWS